MKKEIKQKIDQIRRGEVPEGYKKTKAGIIPNEWKDEEIGTYLQEYSELSNDIQTYQVYSSSRQGLILQSQYYDNRESVETNLGYKMVPDGYATYRHMSDDDIFHFNINYTGNTILVSSEYPVFTVNNRCNLMYIVSILNETPRFRYFCRTQKLGGTRTRLYYKNLRKYRAAFPPLSEQQKITEILSTQDKVIELKERLLIQKQRQQKYIMQQLLTGKQRLPGFTGEWKNICLNDECQVFSGGTPKTGSELYYNNGSIPFIRSAEISKSSTELFITESGFNNSSAKMVNIGDILYALYGANSGNCALSKINGAINQAIICIRPTSLNKVLLYQILNFKKGYIVSKYLQGGQGNLSAAIINNLIITVPIQEEEQEKIALILSVLEHEIEVFQSEIEQEKQKKKALMQLLLTGIVRVNI